MIFFFFFKWLTLVLRTIRGLNQILRDHIYTLGTRLVFKIRLNWIIIIFKACWHVEGRNEEMLSKLKVE